MAAKNRVFFTVLFALTLFLSLEGVSWAPVARTQVEITIVDRWSWLNPLEGVSYSMAQSKDGTIIAVRVHKSLQGSEKIYTVQPLAQSSKASRASLLDPPEPETVYDLWRQRRISCEARRNVPDLFGNVFEACQAAPFKYTAQVSGSTRDTISPGEVSSLRGQVWIFTPPASGKQEPARGSNRPGWGR